MAKRLEGSGLMSLTYASLVRIEAFIGSLVSEWIEPHEGSRGGAPQKPLIAQLYEYSMTMTSKAGSGHSTNKPESRPPGNQIAMYLVDQITEEARELYERFSVAFNDNVRASSIAWYVLADLLHYCRQAVNGDIVSLYPLIRDVEHASAQWVKQVRILLKYDVREIILGEVSCHVCGGKLAVAEDASTDVRCIDSSCAEVYPRSQWVQMLADGA